MIFWKVKSENFNVASLRYRCLLPVKYLKLKGGNSVIYSNQDKIEFRTKPEAIIFVKSFTKHDLKLAKKARQKGIPIILDICDNIFVEGYAAHSKSAPADIFKEMATIAAAIVTTGTSLKSCIESHIDANIPIFIIPDASETMVEFQDHDNLLKENQRIKNRVGKLEKFVLLITEPKSVVSYLKEQLKQKLIGRRNSDRNIKNEQLNNSAKAAADPAEKQEKQRGLPDRTNTGDQNILFNSVSQEMIVNKYCNQARANELKQVIWFGIHGIKFGQKLFKLLDIIPELTAAYQEVNFCLHIVSEKEAYEVYQQYIQPLPIPTKFTPWTQYVNYQSISQSHVTIIPNSLDAFEICKSPNRAILSLALGVPVVATKTPALIPFESCIIFDNWQQGIVSYLKDPDLVLRHITNAQLIIKENYSGDAIADKWLQIIDKIGHKSWTKYLIDKYVEL